MMKAGDHTIPLVDRTDGRLLWDSYTWGAKYMYMEHLGSRFVSATSPGFGAAANSFMDFVNVEEATSIYKIPQNMHRRKDPGAGAFTYYHSRYSHAARDIRQGEELFVTYGDVWFLGRKEVIGPIPVTGDHVKAEGLYRTFRRKFIDQEHRRESIGNDGRDGTKGPPPPPPNPRLAEVVADDLWDTFVLNSSWDDSPTMAAFPPKEHYDDIFYDSTLIEWKKSQMSRSIEWLEEHGICADNLHFGESTLPQAGHGAFASRALRKDKPILPVPLIHIPYRSIMNMYHLDPSTLVPDMDRPRQPQLLLNYCLGHRDSTMLLSPYGPAFGLINHNQTLVNVRLQWASPKRSQHIPERLDEDVSNFEQYTSAQLAMELVATRDIDPGEEIFLDYGDEWETAWQEHVTRWKPPQEADNYQSAYEMNQEFDHIFRTEFEQMHDPYPSNVMLKFHKYFYDDHFRDQWLENHPHPFHEHLNEWQERTSVPCDVLRREQDDSRVLYAIAIVENSEPDEEPEWRIIEDVPQEAIFFQDQPYSTDMFLENAFRHDIRIPDDIFPGKWKNLKLQHDIVDDSDSEDESL
jgi:hypothetical protein